MRRSRAAPLGLEDNATSLFLADKILPQLWGQVTEEAKMEHAVGSTNVTAI
jgi:hypothetical protein